MSHLMPPIRQRAHLHQYTVDTCNSFKCTKPASMVRARLTSAVADPEIVSGGVCGRSRATEGCEGVWRGTPSPRGRGLGRGLCPLHRIFFQFGPQNGQFRCTVGAGGGMHPPHPPPLDPPLDVPNCHITLEFTVLHNRRPLKVTQVNTNLRRTHR